MMPDDMFPPNDAGNGPENPDPNASSHPDQSRPTETDSPFPMGDFAGADGMVDFGNEPFGNMPLPEALPAGNSFPDDSGTDAFSMAAHDQAGDEQFYHLYDQARAFFHTFEYDQALECCTACLALPGLSPEQRQQVTSLQQKIQSAVSGTKVLPAAAEPTLADSDPFGSAPADMPAMDGFGAIDASGFGADPTMGGGFGEPSGFGATDAFGDMTDPFSGQMGSGLPGESPMVDLPKMESDGFGEEWSHTADATGMSMGRPPVGADAPEVMGELPGEISGSDSADTAKTTGMPAAEAAPATPPDEPSDFGFGPEASMPTDMDENLFGSEAGSPFDVSAFDAPTAAGTPMGDWMDTVTEMEGPVVASDATPMGDGGPDDYDTEMPSDEMSRMTRPEMSPDTRAWAMSEFGGATPPGAGGEEKAPVEFFETGDTLELNLSERPKPETTAPSAAATPTAPATPTEPAESPAIAATDTFAGISPSPTETTFEFSPLGIPSSAPAEPAASAPTQPAVEQPTESAPVTPVQPTAPAAAELVTSAATTPTPEATSMPAPTPEPTPTPAPTPEPAPVAAATPAPSNPPTPEPQPAATVPTTPAVTPAPAFAAPTTPAVAATPAVTPQPQPAVTPQPQPAAANLAVGSAMAAAPVMAAPAAPASSMVEPTRGGMVGLSASTETSSISGGAYASAGLRVNTDFTSPRPGVTMEKSGPSAMMIATAAVILILVGIAVVGFMQGKPQANMPIVIDDLNGNKPGGMNRGNQPGNEISQPGNNRNVGPRTNVNRNTNTGQPGNNGGSTTANQNDPDTNANAGNQPDNSNPSTNGNNGGNNGGTQNVNRIPPEPVPGDRFAVALDSAEMALPNGELNVPYRSTDGRTVRLVGQQQKLTFDVFPPLPAGLTLNRQTGDITGTPTEPAAGKFTFRGFDGGGAIAVERELSLRVGTPKLAVALGRMRPQSLPVGGESSLYVDLEIQIDPETPEIDTVVLEMPAEGEVAIEEIYSVNLDGRMLKPGREFTAGEGPNIAISFLRPLGEGNHRLTISGHVASGKTAGQFGIRAWLGKGGEAIQRILPLEPMAMTMEVKDFGVCLASSAFVTSQDVAAGEIGAALNLNIAVEIDETCDGVGAIEISARDLRNPRVWDVRINEMPVEFTELPQRNAVRVNLATPLTTWALISLSMTGDVPNAGEPRFESVKLFGPNESAVVSVPTDDEASLRLVITERPAILVNMPTWTNGQRNVAVFDCQNFVPTDWELKGALPNGLVFAGGVLTGTPTGAAGRYEVTVTATSGTGEAISKSIYILVRGE